MKDYLTFGLLTSYFVWWRFALVTVRRASLPCLVWYRHCWKQLRCKLNTQRLYEEYKILCFKCNICGLPIDDTGTKAFKVPTKWKTSYVLVCWLSILSGGGLHVWLLVALVYLTSTRRSSDLRTRLGLVLGCWLLILSDESLHLWLLGALVYLTFFG